MRELAVIGLCLVFAMATARLGGESKLSPSQAFLKGVHAGMELETNLDVLSLVDSKVISDNELLVALGYLADTSVTVRFHGIQAFYKIFDHLNKTLSDEIAKDDNFTTIVTKTLTVVGDTSQFIYRAGIYQRNIHHDMFITLFSSNELARSSDFFSSGQAFGLVIRNLYDALTPDGSIGHIQPWGNLPSDPNPPIFGLPNSDHFPF
eukprot:TRINITY_DN8241_c0_g1_i3.p1 TRINITY_DN8241_c0_g1~~TRINITY_DN8241_c0_g1_i3.p1  ORF type:complete len:206 (+),score=32.91 TRINITY_DN8241_c0_g1_i3:45-662(+)